MLTDKQKQTKKIYYQEYYKEYKFPNPENRKQYRKKSEQMSTIKRNENALSSLYYGTILNVALWYSWFNKKRDGRRATYDLSAEDAFDLMIKRCFYCGDFAITLDRLDSNLSHTLENCVGCCTFCNSSKGALDPKTFILRAVYRRTFVYYEDDNIWHDNEKKPRLGDCIRSVSEQKRPFNLTNEQFNKLIAGKCHYCKRQTSTSKFFGTDKLYPDDGYVLDNCITACSSCNRAKWDANPDEFTLRDDRITQRYLEGYFDELPSINKNIYNNKKTVCKSVGP